MKSHKLWILSFLLNRLYICNDFVTIFKSFLVNHNYTTRTDHIVGLMGLFDVLFLNLDFVSLNQLCIHIFLTFFPMPSRWWISVLLLPFSHFVGYMTHYGFISCNFICLDLSSSLNSIFTRMLFLSYGVTPIYSLWALIYIYICNDFSYQISQHYINP